MAKMVRSRIEARRYMPVQTGNEENSGVDFTLSLRERHRRRSNSLTALVVSSDENVLQRIAEIVLQCGIPTFLAFTVSEGGRILEARTVSLVVCDERLVDGTYEDILYRTTRLPRETLLIVVSRTGDWPDYLRAISAGAFDYLAYPPIPGDLPYAIHSALTRWNASNSEGTGKFVASRGDIP